MKKIIVRTLLSLVALVILGVFGMTMSAGDRPGDPPSGARLEKIKESPQWNEEAGRFSNELGQFRASFWEMSRKYFFGGANHREPKSGVPFVETDVNLFASPPASGLRVTWLGHSSFIIELDGARVLIDPVWGERVSPFTWAGPTRFHPPPLPLSALPEIDAVLISHDHYDHLDHETVLALKDRSLTWLVPLGVGSHLEYWGIPSGEIKELDWWDEYVVKGVKMTATPARHFSGRSVLFNDENATLWCGWALTGSKRRLFYSGDTALHPEFAEIGHRLGPFDVTIMEVGAYNAMWPDVHLGPEQAVLAHTLVKGKVMLPAHWGLFDLALHAWTEPAERVISAAQTLNVPLVMVRPGGTYDAGSPPTVDRFWPDLPYENVESDPVWSTEVDGLLKAWRSAQ